MKSCIVCKVIGSFAFMFGLSFARGSFGSASSRDVLLEKEVFHRIEVLKSYAPGAFYCWQLRWFEKVQRPLNGQLKGRVDDKFHWVELCFESGDKLCFDKNNPKVAFYPNVLCFYPESEWLKPLGNHRSLCYYLIAMPFLHWSVERFKKTAKMGRRAIQVVFLKNDVEIEVFIDQAFNAILQVIIRLSGEVYGKFSLSHFKRFSQGWGIGWAEYVLRGLKTKMKVVSIENQ